MGGREAVRISLPGRSFFRVEANIGFFSMGFSGKWSCQEWLEYLSERYEISTAERVVVFVDGGHLDQAGAMLCIEEVLADARALEFVRFEFPSATYIYNVESDEPQGGTELGGMYRRFDEEVTDLLIRGGSPAITAAMDELMPHLERLTMYLET
ncbi:MAG TPA: hypothetical protein VF272_01955 [Candidatus Saccharimonadia bacterium]